MCSPRSISHVYKRVMDKEETFPESKDRDNRQGNSSQEGDREAARRSNQGIHSTIKERNLLQFLTSGLDNSYGPVTSGHFPFPCFQMGFFIVVILLLFYQFYFRCDGKITYY